MSRALLRITSLLLGVQLLACAAAPTDPVLAEGGRRVLFIGNSLTYTNDLPRTIAGLARTMWETPLVYRTVAEPDYALEDHWNAGIAQMIASDRWELVVMQQGPSSLVENQANLRLWTITLDEAVRAAGARSALFQVWPAAQYAGSFTAVRDSYRAAAIAVDGMFIPAGEAWRTAWAADPTLALYGPDGFHPSRLGTYLTALVHFEMIYDRSATELPDVAVVDGVRLSLPPATVALLQQAAHETVLAWGIR